MDPEAADSWHPVAQLLGEVEAHSVTMAEFTGLAAACLLMWSVVPHAPLTSPLQSLEECVLILRKVAGF